MAIVVAVAGMALLTVSGRAQSSNPQSIHLTTGWNLFGWLYPTQDIGPAIAPIADETMVIWGFDQAMQTWHGYFPAAASVPGANDLTSFQSGLGYFINITSAEDWTPGSPGSVTPTPTTTSTPSASGFKVTFIDVGQGDSELISVGTHNLLIDGGKSGTLITQRLQALGVTDLDAVMATHPDADHVGGLTAVLAAYPVERIYVDGDPATTQTYTDFLAAANAEPGAQVITSKRGDSIALGDLALPVLAPVAPSGDTNNDSIVTRIGCGNVSVQFEGDAATAEEQSMVDAGILSHVTVLKVGHHGSSTSSSVPFLNAVTPTFAVISAGLNNQYGHPTQQTLTALAAVGAQFEYSDMTSGDDSVTFTTNCSTYTWSKPPTTAQYPGMVLGSATTTATPTQTTTAAPTETATPSPTPGGVRTGAVCKDGTTSTATGSGACSGHGGVDHWLYG